jgi:hypothetical protein
MSYRRYVLIGMICFAASVVCCGRPLGAATYRIAETLAIDTVPSWFPVGFCLLTHQSKQYVGYYNARHEMIVARRQLGDRRWGKTRLPSKVGWDSHNYVTLAVDAAGDVHVAGNMHCVPLIYFRTRKPGDITTFERQPMTGLEEGRCTYPRFVYGADRNLLFTYRSGGSGNGRRFYNIFDIKTRTWSRFIDTPLFEGKGLRNAYPNGPTLGPDGLFHVVWVWRDTPDCATNHHLSYARSRDLRQWETAAGEPVELPLTLEQSTTWVDPIPPGGGIINGCEKLAFDMHNRPIVSYHKRDNDDHMQIYVARFEQGGWQCRPITAWSEQIAFSGGGAMPFIGIRITELKRLQSGMFFIKYTHRDHGSGRIVVGEETLRPVQRDVAIPREYPMGLMVPTISFPGMHVRIADDLGTRADPDTKYVLRWETLEAHYDRPRKPPLPRASRLTLVTLKASLAADSGSSFNRDPE